jgi:prepilin-type N-terminal cleavage/methylation domain-containing protein
MLESVKRGFTLVELLVVVAIVAILAAVLFPVFSRAKAAAAKTACTSNLRQTGVALALYLADSDDQMPDRRDLKVSLGFRPWTGWPPSDPRAGWAGVVLWPYSKSRIVTSCPATESAFRSEPRVEQDYGLGRATVWMWRFDRTDDPVPLDNFWGKSPEQAVADLQALNDRIIGYPEGVSDVELAVDPYFPKTIASVPDNLKGRAVHFGGRNRLFLDGRVRFLRDVRTD